MCKTINIKGTPQQVFDKVIAHLRKQGKKSVVTDEFEDRIVCRYRGPEGCMCALGVLISDDDYSPNIEGLPISMLSLRLRLVDAAHLQGTMYSLLTELQKTHDMFDVSQWEARFEYIAARFRLTLQAV